MPLFKFSIGLWVILVTCGAWAIDDTACLTTSFDTSITHWTSPFGLLQKILKINKKDCVLTIEHERLRFMKKKWLVDVCREPVHIKFGESMEVIKKKFPCELAATDKADEFCNNLEELKLLIQDDGLIFAEGEKEDLNSNHGKVYCAYLLVKAYLARDVIFNRHETYQNVLESKKAITVPLPVEPEALHAPETTATQDKAEKIQTR